MHAVDSAIGVVLLIGGGFALYGGGHIWHAANDRSNPAQQPGKHWETLVVLLLFLAGIGLGAGMALTGFFAGFFNYMIVGYVPVWLIIGLLAGIWALVDLMLRHDWTRTPILVGITAAMIAIPAAPAIANGSVHGHAPQVTSVTRTHRG